MGAMLSIHSGDKDGAPTDARSNLSQICLPDYRPGEFEKEHVIWIETRL